jgi:hypothetical protein
VRKNNIGMYLVGVADKISQNFYISPEEMYISYQNTSEYGTPNSRSSLNQNEGHNYFTHFLVLV